MNETPISSSSSMNSHKIPSPVSLYPRSPDEFASPLEFSSNREQKKSEERRKCKRRDEDFLVMREEIISLAKAMHRQDAVRIKMWLKKLDETLSLLAWKNNRNQYAALLIKQLRLGYLGEFFAHIPSGHLGNLPSHLKQSALLNDEIHRKESDTQKMSPSVASLMPNQANNPFFCLKESEIPSSPCSESVGSDSSLNPKNVLQIARRVSFSPKANASFTMPSPSHSQINAKVGAVPFLKSSVSKPQAQQVENDFSRLSLNQVSVESSKGHVQEILPKSPTEASLLRSNSNISHHHHHHHQSNQGIPNELSPGLVVANLPNSGTFAARTHGSPRLHSPAPKPRFSSHDIVKAQSNSVTKRSTPEKKEIVNGVSCSPPSLVHSNFRSQESRIPMPGSSLLRFEETSKDLSFKGEIIRTPVSKLQQLKEPHSPRNLSLTGNNY